MTTVQVSKIQHRRGDRADLPEQLEAAELGWSQNTRELFIGNGPLGGNTQIITDASESQDAAQYQYKGNAIVKAFENETNPPERSMQSKLDDIVSARDFGALGLYSFTETNNGLISDQDDYDALNDALTRLFSENNNLSSGPNDPLQRDPRHRRVLYLPAGVYRITQTLPLFPWTTIVGDGSGKSVIFLDYDSMTPDNQAVFHTVDGVGSNDSSSTPNHYSKYIRMQGVSLVTNAPTNSNDIDICVLLNTINAHFVDVEFRGIHSPGVNSNTPGLSGVYCGQNIANNTLIDSTDTSGKIQKELAVNDGQPGHYVFERCTFFRCKYGINMPHKTHDVKISNCRFHTCDYGVKAGLDLGATDTPSRNYFAATGSNDVPFNGDMTGPSQISINNTDFKGNSQAGIFVLENSGGVSSSNNYFDDDTNNGNQTGILIGDNGNTVSSMGDYFEATTTTGTSTSRKIKINGILSNRDILIVNPQDTITQI